MKPQKQGLNKTHIIKIFSIAALLFGAAILFYACENDIEQIKAFSSPEDLPVIEAQNFETLFSDSGEVRFFLKTTKLLQFENGGKSFVEFPEGMKLIKYDENKVIISIITANYAKQFIQEEKWEAKNNVIATNATGDTLKTEHLIWEEKTEKIYTDEFVKIIRANQIITGIGFQSDQNLSNWRIKDPKGTIYVSVGDTPSTQIDSTAPPAIKDSTLVKPPERKLEFQ